MLWRIHMFYHTLTSFNVFLLRIDMCFVLLCRWSVYLVVLSLNNNNLYSLHKYKAHKYIKSKHVIIQKVQWLQVYIKIRSTEN